MKLLGNSRRIGTILRGIGRDSTGAEIVEAAIVMPLMFMFLLGIFWFGRAYNIYATINHAAREGARVGVAPSCATCGNAAITGDEVAARVKSALEASNLNPGAVTSTPPALCPCGTASCGTSVACETIAGGNPQICMQKNVALTSGTPSACGTVVSFRYPFKFHFPFTSLDKQQINLRAQVQMRNDN